MKSLHSIFTSAILFEADCNTWNYGVIIIPLTKVKVQRLKDLAMIVLRKNMEELEYKQ